MITRDLLEAKGFVSKDFANGWYSLDLGYFSLALFLDDNKCKCFLFSNDSGDREATVFLNVDINKLDCILDFINNYNKFV